MASGVGVVSAVGVASGVDVASGVGVASAVGVAGDAPQPGAVEPITVKPPVALLRRSLASVAFTEM